MIHQNMHYRDVSYTYVHHLALFCTMSQYYVHMVGYVTDYTVWCKTQYCILSAWHIRGHAFVLLKLLTYCTKWRERA